MTQITARRGVEAAVRASRTSQVGWQAPTLDRPFLTACSPCQRLKTDGIWTDVYLVSPGEGQKVSHGICPRCFDRLYGGTP